MLFIWLPGAFIRYFILCLRIFHCTFHMVAWHFHSTCQGPSNGRLGWWSHDPLPKMVKKQKLKPCTVAFRICWNYVLGCSHCGDMRIKISLSATFFFVFCIFLHENNSKSHDFNTFIKWWEGAIIVVSWENWPKMEGAYPKKEIDIDRLQKITGRPQKSLMDYNIY